MYEEYFGLREEPFSIAPDPHYMYMSQGHREALAHLLYGIERDGGFVLLTGEVGTGKTTVCRCLLDEVPGTTDVAFILNPKLTAEELLATVCDEFGIPYPDGNTSVKIFVSRINDYLLDVHTRGRRAVLIIEEAQNLSVDVLEQIRLLTNLETNQRKLLQIIMVAQPEITEKLSQPQLRQLSQRITARYHLGPLSQKDVAAYVNYRLKVAGLVRGELFPQPILKRLFRLTAGVPRLINVICDRALLGAYVQGKDRVDLETLKRAAREVSGRGPRQRKRIYKGIAAGLLLASFTALGTTYYIYGPGPFWRPVSNKVTQEPAVSGKPDIVPASLLERLDDASVDTRDAAYQALFEEWQINYSSKQSKAVCEQARQQGLQCVQGTGSISDLRQMNKPAVLRLLGVKGNEYYAALTSLREEDVTMLINDERGSVRVKELSKRWSGEYLLLWRTPKEYRKELKPGDSSTLVPWVGRHLAQDQGWPPRAGGTLLYDEKMVNQVKEFQRAAGLRPDGVVGSWTIMRLSEVDGDEPVLDHGQGTN
ncbi:MAG TPA: AAA family ATPase [Syntrophorhabdales bacterium]|nr:AAA family ATPase [Syntrophorhabdales bacterium]